MFSNYGSEKNFFHIACIGCFVSTEFLTSGWWILTEKNELFIHNTFMLLIILREQHLLLYLFVVTPEQKLSVKKYITEKKIPFPNFVAGSE